VAAASDLEEPIPLQPPRAHAQRGFLCPAAVMLSCAASPEDKGRRDTGRVREEPPASPRARKKSGCEGYIFQEPQRSSWSSINSVQTCISKPSPVGAHLYTAGPVTTTFLPSRSIISLLRLLLGPRLPFLVKQQFSKYYCQGH
jgi:hypothetical protein